MSQTQMDANMLFERLKYCAMVILLDLPSGSDFGIDYCSWTVGPKFKGVKLVPPGLHYVHAALPQVPYEFASRDLGLVDGKEKLSPHSQAQWTPRSTNSPTTSQGGVQIEVIQDEDEDSASNERQKLTQKKYGVTLRRGGWFYLLPGDVAVLKWNPHTESCTWIRPHREWVKELGNKFLAVYDDHDEQRIRADITYLLSVVDHPKSKLLYASSREEAEEHERVSRAARRMEFDQNLGVYPSDKLGQWTQLVGSVGAVVFLECFGALQSNSPTIVDGKKDEVDMNGCIERRETRFDRIEKISKLYQIQSQSQAHTLDQARGEQKQDMKTDFNESEEISVIGDLRMVEIPLPSVCRDCSPEAVTRLTHDRTVNTLEWLLMVSDKYKSVSGALKLQDAVRQELQLVFTNLLIGQSYGAFDTWSKILDALCNSERLLDHTIKLIIADGITGPYAPDLCKTDVQNFQNSRQEIWSQMKSVQTVDNYLMYLISALYSQWDGPALSQATHFVSLYCTMIDTVSNQITLQLPQDMFIDALGKESFLRPSFKSLFQIFDETWSEFESAWSSYHLHNDLKERNSDCLLRLRAQWLRLFKSMKKFEKELGQRPGWKGKASDMRSQIDRKQELTNADGYLTEEDEEGLDDEDVVIVDEEEAKRYGFT